MLCSCYRDGQWGWLSAHETPGTNGLVLLERRGECPGDPDGTVARLIGLVDPDRLTSEAAAWLHRAWASASGAEKPFCLFPNPAVHGR